MDFILKFGFGIIRGEILNAARYGVWSYHHADEEKYRGSPPCFWEIYRGDNVTGAMLQRLTNRLDGGIVLKKGYFSTIKSSYAENLDQSYYESAKWPAQVCVDISNSNADYLNAAPSQTTAPILHSPTNLQMLVFALILLRNRLAVRWRSLFRHEKWNREREPTWQESQKRISSRAAPGGRPPTEPLRANLPLPGSRAGRDRRLRTEER